MSLISEKWDLEEAVDLQVWTLYSKFILGSVILAISWQIVLCIIWGKFSSYLATLVNYSTKWSFVGLAIPWIFVLWRLNRKYKRQANWILGQIFHLVEIC